jgi:dissimilatory sulfite reductase (desulfoviridin) alpha/beta subunit
MKARRKGTNDTFREIEMTSIKNVEGLYLAEELEFEQEPNTIDHWQDVREKAAIAAVQGYTSCKCQLVDTINLAMAEGITDQAVMIADTLVKKLKGE